jgi:hypothetical protein
VYHISIGLCCLHWAGLDVPDAISILVDCTIAREEAHPADACNALGDPSILILVTLVNEILGFEVAFEVVRYQVVVTMINNGINQSLELICTSELSASNGVEDSLKSSVDGLGGEAVSMSEILNILSNVSEQEDVVFTNLTGDFDLSY